MTPSDVFLLHIPLSRPCLLSPSPTPLYVSLPRVLVLALTLALSLVLVLALILALTRALALVLALILLARPGLTRSHGSSSLVSTRSPDSLH